MSGILDIDNVSVQFGGVRALSGVTLHVAEHEVFGVIGPNGAGKTTLFNCISGFIKPLKEGGISFAGTSLVGMPVYRIAKIGIARTFQNIALMRDQTVRMNLMVGLHLTLGYNPLAALLPSRRVAIDEAVARQRVEKATDLLQISRGVLDQRVGELPLGLQKKVELAKAIVRDARLLLLDEPAGGLNDSETQALTRSIEILRSQADMTIVLVDHDMNLVMEVCHRIAVLDFGHLLITGDAAAVRRDPRVIEAYLGTRDA